MAESTSSPSLPSTGQPEAHGENHHHPHREYEKPFVESTDPSTETSSVLNAVDEKPERLQDQDDGPATPDEKAVDEEEAPKDTPSYPKGMEVFFIMLALVLSIMLVSLDQTIVATAIPTITTQFHSLPDIAWYGSSYFLTISAFQSQWGKIYKYFALKTAFLVAIFIFELGSLICAVAQNSTTLIVGRAVAGLGASGIAPGAYTISAFAAEPHKRATYTGVIGASYGISAVLGPLIGGGLTSATTWRWCFYINLPIGGLAALTIFLTFKTPAAFKVTDATFKEKLLHMDFPATALVLCASLCLLLALEYGGVTHPWSSSLVVGLLVGFVLIVAALVAIEIWQGERAMLTPRLLHQRTVLVPGIWGFFFAGAYFVTLYYLPIYFQAIDDVSPIGSGVRNIPLIAMFSIATYGSGVTITKTGVAAPYMTIGSVLVTIAAGLLFTLDIGTSTGKWVGYQLLAGFGYGVALQVPVVVAQAFAKPSDIAPVTAIIIFFRGIGGTFLIAAAQSSFVNQLVHKLASTAPSVDSALVIATGATDVHDVFSGAVLDGVVRAYAWGVKVAFAIAIVATGVTVPINLFNRWDNVNAKKAVGGSGKA